MNVVERTKNILLNPASEWQVIKSENLTVADMFKNYAMILAAIPAIAGFIGYTIFGYGFGSYRIGIGTGLAWAVLTYIIGLAGVYVVSVIVDVLAPSFNSTKNIIASTKLVVFSYTAAWVAGIFSIIPILGFIGVIGALYSLYLMYKGLPVIKDVPQDKVLGYFIVIIIVTIVVYIVVGLIVSGIAFGGLMMSRW